MTFNNASIRPPDCVGAHGLVALGTMLSTRPGAVGAIPPSELPSSAEQDRLLQPTDYRVGCRAQRCGTRAFSPISASVCADMLGHRFFEVART
jgi:hypothetical protein